MALMVPLEKRIWELMDCLERRQSQSTDGYVDFGLAISHWAYDFMVCNSRLYFQLPGTDVLSGRYGVRRMQ